MIEIGVERIAIQDRIWVDGWVKMRKQGTTVTSLLPKPGFGHFYVKELVGVTHLFFKNDLGVEFDLCHQIGGGDTTIINEFITNNFISGGNDHLHGLSHWLADGVLTAFELPDVAEYIEFVT